jgi:hypothetical protein
MAKNDGTEWGAEDKRRQEEHEVTLANNKIEMKNQKIMTLLSVVTTIGDKFIQDKELKDRVVNRATSLLENELEDY